LLLIKLDPVSGRLDRVTHYLTLLHPYNMDRVKSVFLGWSDACWLIRKHRHLYF